MGKPKPHKKPVRNPHFFGGVLPPEALTSYLTTAEAAKRLHISDRRVRELIRNGRLTAFRKGKSYLIHKDAFLAFAALKRGPGRPKPDDGLEILKVSSRITIAAVAEGTDGPDWEAITNEKPQEEEGGERQ